MEKARELLEAEFKEEFGEEWWNQLRDFEHAFSDYYNISMNTIRKALYMTDISGPYSAEKVLEMLETVNDIEDAKDLFRDNWIE